MIKNFLLLSVCFIAIACNNPKENSEVKEVVKDYGCSPASEFVKGAFATNLKMGEGKFKVVSKGNRIELVIPMEAVKPYETNEKWKQRAKEIDRDFQGVMFNSYEMELTLLDSNNAPVAEAAEFDHGMSLEVSDILLKGSGQLYVEFYRSYSKEDSLKRESDLEMLKKNAVKYAVNTSLRYDL